MCTYIYIKAIMIAAFVWVQISAYAQSEMRISLTNVVNVLSLEAPAAQMERLNFENEIIRFENYKKGFLPSVSIDVSPLSFNRSIVKLQQASDGQYNYVEDYSSNTSAGMSIQQKIPFTGGTLSANTNLNYLNELSRSRHSFSSTPFAIRYSQQLFGGRKTMRMEKTLEYQKNEENVKKYCVAISGIQHRAMTLFMNVFLNRMEMELASSNKAATDSLLRIAEVKYLNLRITESDFKQLELQAVNNDYLKENAKNSYEEALRALTTYLGVHQTPNDVTIERPEFTLPVKIDVEAVRYYIDKNNPKALSNHIKHLEAQKNLYSAELQNRFNASINLSYGMNQYGATLKNVFANPSQQQGVSIGFSIPISLWGINRNSARIARNTYRSSMIGLEQEMDLFENEIYETVNSYHHQVNLWFIAERSYQLAQEQYKLVVEEYAMGKSTAYELIASQKEQSAALQKYYNAIKNVWESYFKIRELTLYDFQKEMELRDELMNNEQ